MRKTYLLAAAALATMLVTPPGARAQDFVIEPIISMDVIIGNAAIDHVTQSERARAEAMEGTDATGADLTYRADPRRTAANLRSFIAGSPGEAGAQLEALVAAQPDIVELIREGVRAYGFDPLNAGDAYAVWWMNAWLASEQRNDDPDAATIAAVIAQSRAALAETPEFVAAGEAERQEFAEAMLVQAAMLGAYMDQAESDAAMRAQLAQATRMSALANGIDLRSLALTQNGFVAR